MIPTRSWVLIIGSAGAVFAAAHAYTFRVIGESGTFSPENVGQRLTFFAGAPGLFLVWIFSAALLMIALIAMLPAMWVALGRGWAASTVVGLLLVGAGATLLGDGAQYPTLSLSTHYASAPEALRPGLEAAAIDVNSAVTSILGVALLPIFVGALAAAVVSAVRRPPGGRWYGLLFFAFWLANAPIPGALRFGVLNLILFGAFAWATTRALRSETAS